MEIKVTFSDAVVYITPTEEWGLDSIVEVKNKLDEIRQMNSAKYVFDLKNVKRMDSSILGILVWFKKTQPDCAMIFKNVNERIRKLFEISHLDSIFSVVEDVESPPPKGRD